MSDKPKAKKKNWANYKISAKFTAWAAPIVEASYGFTSDQDILDYMRDTTMGELNNIPEPVMPDEPLKPVPINDAYKASMKEYKDDLKEYNIAIILHNTCLADEILPQIDKGIQPIGPTGPIASFRTKNHKWESNTPEYKKMRRTIFGQPEVPEEKPITKEVSYNIGKTYGKG